MSFMEKEVEKLKKKAAEFDEKRYENFLNYQDTGYGKYYRQMDKAEKERDEIEEFVYAQERVKDLESKLNKHYKFEAGLKQKLTELLEEYNARTHPDANSALGYIFSFIAIEEP